MAGELFGCSQPTVSRWWRRLAPIVSAALAGLAEAVVAQESRSALLVDGFLAPTEHRHGAPQLYSGKRHADGFNVQAVTTLAGRVIDTGDPLPGSCHDAKAFTGSGVADRYATHYAVAGPGMVGDKGYLGTGVLTPQRTLPGRALTGDQKRDNRSINRIRAPAERGIAHLKNQKILKTGYRGRLHEFPDLLRTVTRLEIHRVWGRVPELMGT